MTGTQICDYIKELTLTGVRWDAYLDRARYPLTSQAWEEEQTMLQAIRTAMPWGGDLWKNKRSSFAETLQMSHGPTYDVGCKLLARRLIEHLIEDTKSSAAQGHGNIPSGDFMQGPVPSPERMERPEEQEGTEPLPCMASPQ